MLLQSVTTGIGLFLILPLLDLIGLSVGGGHPRLMAPIQTSFDALGLPLNLVSMLVFYTLVLSLVAWIGYMEQVTSNRLQKGYTQHLRLKLYQALLDVPWPFFLSRKLSDMLHVLTTQVQGVTLCNHQALRLINQFFLVSAYIALGFMLSWQMTLCAVACGMLLLALMLPAQRLTSKVGKRQLEQSQTLFQSITEQLSALKMIKATALEPEFMAILSQNSNQAETQLQQIMLLTERNRLLFRLVSVALLSVFMYAALNIFLLPVATVLLLFIVFARVLPLVSSTQQMYQRLLQHLPAFDGISEFEQSLKHAMPEDTPQKPIAFNTAIRVEHLSFAYPKTPHQQVLSELSCVIPKNKTICISGPSGVGKSTFADMLTGLIKPTEGGVWVDDTRLSEAHSQSWRKRIAYVTQDPFLFHATVRDNLTWFKNDRSDEALYEALKLARADFVLQLEDGLETMIGDRGVRLSGGERQRLALARALLMQPDILILDESTNALDTENVEAIQGVLNALHGRMTIIIITHQLEMIKLADQVIELTAQKKELNPRSSHAAMDAIKTTTV